MKSVMTSMTLREPEIQFEPDGEIRADSIFGHFPFSKPETAGNTLPEELRIDRRLVKSAYNPTKHTEYALFCFHREHWLRNKAIGLVEHNLFTRLINITILINCVMLILATVEQYRAAAEEAELWFTVAFLLEFILKVTAFGFLQGKTAYLKDAWNWIDFFVVVIGAISLTPFTSRNLTALRLFRLVKPLKSINALPNMKRFINTLVNSLFDLSSVFALMLFFYLFFAIFGLSVLDRLLDLRCRTTLQPEAGRFEVDPQMNRLCGGTNTCGGRNTFCLSFVDFQVDGRYFIDPSISVKDEKNEVFLNFGATNFENIFNALFSVFLVGQKDGWIEMMFMVMEGYNYYFGLIFFLMIIIVLGFFIVNLTAAVMLFNFEKNRFVETVTDDKSNFQRLKDFVKLSQREAKLDRKEFLSPEEIQEKKRMIRRNHHLIRDVGFYEKDCKEGVSLWFKLKSIKCFKRRNLGNKHWLKEYCKLISEQPAFTYLVTLVIVLNTIVLCFERVDQPESEKNFLEVLNAVFVIIFCLEAAILIISKGAKYFGKLSNWWDLTICTVSLVEVFIWYIYGEIYDGSASIFRIFRIFRIIKVVRTDSNIRIAVNSIKYTVKRMGEYFVFLVLFLLIFTLVGFELFHDKLVFDESVLFSYSTATEYRLNFNFDTFFNAFLCVFCVLIGNNYVYIVFYSIYSKHTEYFSTVFYYVLLILVGHISLVNVFLAYFIDNFLTAREYLYKNVLVESFLSKAYAYIPLSYKISAEKELKQKRTLKGLFKLYANNEEEDEIDSVRLFLLSKVHKIDFKYRRIQMKSFRKGVEEGESMFNFDECFIDNSAKYRFYRTNEKLSIGKPTVERRNSALSSKQEVIRYMSTRSPRERSPRIEVQNVSEMYFGLNSSRNLLERSSEEEKTRNFKFEKTILKRQLETPKDGYFNVLVESNKKSASIDSNKTVKIYKDIGEKEFGLTSTTHSVSGKQFYFIAKPCFEASFEDSTKETRIVRLAQNVSPVDTFDPKVLRSEYRKKNYLSKLIKRAKSKKNKRNRTVERLWESSFFVFHKDSWIVKAAKKVIKSIYFVNFIYACIFISTLIIIFDRPYLASSSLQKNLIDNTNTVLTFIFFFELLLKSVASSFFIPNKAKSAEIKGEKAETKVEKIEKYNKPYLYSVSNWIDLFVVIVSLIELVSARNLGFFKVLRIMKSLRPLRIITKSDSLKLIINSCYKSLPAIGHVLALWTVFVLVYSILGIFLFKDSVYACSNPDIIGKEECEAAGLDFTFKRENFSNFLFAFKLLFRLMSAEQWNTFVDKESKGQNAFFVYFFYLSYIVIGFFFVLNLLVSVVVQKFKYFKERENSVKTLREEEYDWVKVQKIMMKFKPTPSFKGKNKLLDIVDSFWFDTAINFFVLVSVLNLALHYKNSPYDKYLELVNYGIALIFNLEIVVKIAAYDKMYFKIYWNLFDFVIVLATDVMIGMKLFFDEEEFHDTSLTIPLVMRIFRVFRMFRLITRYSKIRSIIDSLLYLLPSIYNIGSLLLVLLLIFGSFGMNIFGTVMRREYVHDNSNFETVMSSILVLFRTSTGEGWNYIMEEVGYHNCTVPGSEDYLKDYFCSTFGGTCVEYIPDYEELAQGVRFCGSDFSFFYFISFIVVTPFLVMNLCIVLVIEGFSDSMYQNESLLSEGMMKIFVNTWIKYDKDCSLKVKPHEFVLILKEMCPSLGLNYDRFYLEDKKQLNYKNMKKHLKGSKKEGFYIGKTRNIYTTQIEIIRTLDKYSFKCEIEDLDLDKMRIDFVDACVNLSREVISRKYKVPVAKLREELVGEVTSKLWQKKYKQFMRQSGILLSLKERVALHMIAKVKIAIRKKLDQVREKIRKRNEATHTRKALSMETPRINL